MGTIFLKLLNMSIAASWLILAVLLLRIFLRKAPKWVISVLWGMTALRLICPFSLQMPFSLIPSAEVLSMDMVQYAENPTVNTGISFLDRWLNPVISRNFEPAPGASVNPLYVCMFLCGILWAAGCVFLLGYGAVSYLCLGRAVRESAAAAPSVWVCDAVKSPLILGFFRPGIYLPSQAGDRFCTSWGGLPPAEGKGHPCDLEPQLQYVIAHEQMHLRRKDHWRKALGYVLLAVYWFHPLVWAAYWFFCRDLELACDETVIQDFDSTEKKAYVNALMSCSMQQNRKTACPLAFGEAYIKERTEMVLNYRKPAFSATAAGVAVCAVTAACLLTDPPVSAFHGSSAGNGGELGMESDSSETAHSQELP